MLFIMRGASCSGKSKVVEQYFESGQVLSSDRFREMYCGNIAEQRFNSVLFDKLREVLENRLQWKVKYTVIDATNLKFKDIEGYLKLAAEYGETTTILSIDPPSFEQLIERAEQRGNDGGLKTPISVLETHFNRYYDAMPTFIENEQFWNYKFIRLNQDLELVE